MLCKEGDATGHIGYIMKMQIYENKINAKQLFLFFIYFPKAFLSAFI